MKDHIEIHIGKRFGKSEHVLMVSKWGSSINIDLYDNDDEDFIGGKISKEEIDRLVEFLNND